jgi:chemotaxis protein CheD
VKEVTSTRTMAQVIKVGMADLKVSLHPSVLVTLGLGSCVGVGLYEPYSRIIGMAHIMLPSSLQSTRKGNLAKFADTAIDMLVYEMVGLGAYRSAIVAKIAGGAQMFSFSSSTDIMRIGERNVAAVKESLSKHQILISSEDVGGNFGRTVELHSEDGRMVIRTIGHGVKEI